LQIVKNRQMKYFIIAGEASGDLHGANLVRELKRIDSHAQFSFWGGDAMAEQIGKAPKKHIKELAFMGFVEVLKNIFTIFKNFKQCKKDILDFKPDAVILIDYPGFNLRMAKFIHQNNIKVLYYISPTVWAWKESRVKTIKKYVDQMYVILPFEKPFYQKHQYEVAYFGHPLLDAMSLYSTNKRPTLEEFKTSHSLDNRPIVAVLPGSRVKEVNVKLPIMLALVEQFPQFQFVVSVAPALDLSIFEPIIANKNVKLVVNKTYDLLSHSHSAIVTSGTATLETALFKIPQVVCYKGDALSFKIAKLIVDVKYISLVNLILDKKSVTELIQDDLTVENLVREFKKIIDGQTRNDILNDYNVLENALGGSGASKRIAEHMTQNLN